jgi:hypothetical protein
MEESHEDVIKRLTRERDEALAQVPYRHAFASNALHKLSTDRLLGSGVILSLTLLGGQQPFEPVMISNGLSNETIKALRNDLFRSFQYNTEVKPMEF